ncbi:hypothetical protein PSNIH2_04915 [Pantoea sp. PSNIH2]|nr:hypothetical protein PSNIH2_04915 [Pantoea sp. PSNIH2]
MHASNMVYQPVKYMYHLDIHNDQLLFQAPKLKFSFYQKHHRLAASMKRVRYSALAGQSTPADLVHTDKDSSRL